MCNSTNLTMTQLASGLKDRGWSLEYGTDQLIIYIDPIRGPFMEICGDARSVTLYDLTRQLLEIYELEVPHWDSVYQFVITDASKARQAADELFHAFDLEYMLDCAVEHTFGVGSLRLLSDIGDGLPEEQMNEITKRLVCFHFLHEAMVSLRYLLGCLAGHIAEIEAGYLRAADDPVPETITLFEDPERASMLQLAEICPQATPHMDHVTAESFMTQFDVAPAASLA